MASYSNTLSLLLLVALLGLARAQGVTTYTLTPGDNAVMQQFLKLPGVSKVVTGSNPCNWTDDNAFAVYCGGSPGAARVLGMRWFDAAGNLDTVEVEKLDALQSLFINAGDSPAFVMSAKTAWATNLNSLTGIVLYAGVSNFSNWLSTPGFPALTSLSCSIQGGGTLPEAKPGAFPALQQLSFQNSGLYGTLPLSWGLDTFPSLQSLSLTENGFSGKLPTYQSGKYWPNLTSLDLSFNAFTGTVPNEWATGQAFGSLWNVQLYGNPNLTGPLPPDWSTGLFRPTPTSLNYLRQAIEGTNVPPNDPNNDLTSAKALTNWGGPFLDPEYTFSNTGVFGAIPSQWSKQSVVDALQAIGLYHNATALANGGGDGTVSSPVFPHLQVAVDGTKVCGAFPTNTSAGQVAGDRGPVTPLPSC